MRRFWWWFRLALFGVVFVGLGLYLFSSAPWRKWFGLAPDYAALLTTGNKLVAGVHAFRADCGLWPQYLEDLVPDYADPLLLEPQAAAAGGRWFYDLTQVSDDTASSGTRLLPSLSIRLPESSRAHLGYDFDPQSPAWHVFGNIESKRLDVPTPALPAPRTTKDVQAAALAELDHRIAREPREVEHRRMKAGLFIQMGRPAEAREVVMQAQADLPDSYWPRMAQCVLDTPLAIAPYRPPATAPATIPAEQLDAFAQWVQSRPSLTRWFYLSVLQRLSEQPGAAAASMAKAAAHPVEVSADDSNIAAYYLWDMTRWALEARRWPLVIELADTWELAHREKLVADASFLPLRAAARLATGNVAGAQLDLTTFDALPAPRRAWAQNIDTPNGLRNAITNADRAYHYSPGNLPAPFQVFPSPD